MTVTVESWIAAQAAKGNAFAQSLGRTLVRYGSLTPRQRECVLASIVRDADALAQPAPSVSVDALKAAFDQAFQRGLKRPRIKMETLIVSRAPDTGANAGALYVKSTDEGTYLGKVAGGRFVRSRDCTAEQQTAVLALLASPLDQVVAYGRRTGQCAICSRLLTDANSVDRGIGPICAEKFGF